MKEKKKKALTFYPTRKRTYLPVCKESVAEHDTLLVERVSVYVRFIVVRVALVHQVILDHTSNSFSYRDSTTTQRLHTIPENL